MKNNDNLVECTPEELIFGDKALTPADYQRRMGYYQIFKSLSLMSVEKLVEMRPRIKADIKTKSETLNSNPEALGGVLDILIALAISEAAEREGIEDDESDKIFNELMV